MAITLTVEVPDDAPSILRIPQEQLGRELCLAATARWYEMGRISQDKAAELAGLSRSAFIETLSRQGANAPAEEIEQEMYAALGGHG